MGAQFRVVPSEAEDGGATVLRPPSPIKQQAELQCLQHVCVALAVYSWTNDNMLRSTTVVYNTLSLIYDTLN